jgi:ATP-dependent RNA helicase SUPV3L1/SUV3
MEAKQFKITDDGQVFYQANVTNPLPGVVIGKLSKGEHILSPTFEIAETSPLTLEQVGEGLQLHVDTILAPLAAMRDLDDLPDPVAQICSAIYEGAGIADRSELQGAIAALDNDMRAVLRAKNVRLGPILVFCPDLNKPAAVRMRALFYAMFHEIALPAPVIPDGMVSKTVEADDVLKGFYRAISYPVYGKRAIRIDMLDRVVNQVYELADKGKFQAQHQMAEWLGCGIEDLYAVLSALGHTKIEEAAPVAADETAVAVEVEPVVEPVAVVAEVSEEAVAPVEAEKAVVEKPALAWFYLKKGKAHQSKAQGGKKPAFKNNDKKPFKKPNKPKRKEQDRKPAFNEPRVYSAEAKKPAVDDDKSPWAALAQFKK